jgi:NAD-reducing hydrogenase large subunit
MKTPKAQKEFESFRALANGRPVHGSFHFHQARLIETLAAIEEIQATLQDPEITNDDVQAMASRNQAEGIGCSESPRGTLFHHYTTDPDGILTRVNLLIATGQNNPSMNRAILETARRAIHGPEVPEGALNRIEGAIRCYDPCLSCSTHALGQMPMVVEILDARGSLLTSTRRGES